MILEIGKQFKNCVVERKVSSDDCRYREVYVCESGDEHVMLTVYSVNDMPNCMNHDKIQEFEICSRLRGGSFMKYIDHGVEVYEGNNVAWMTTEFTPYQTLRDVSAMNVLAEKDILDIFCDIMVGLKELSGLTGGGGHYNLTPDTVVVSDMGDSDRDLQAYIIGLEHASYTSAGCPTFDVKTLDSLYRAKETFVGRFSVQSDIYSLGMLLAFMLNAGYPYEIKEGLTPMQLSKYISKQKLELMAPDRLVNIVKRAISQKVSERYNGMEELWNDVMEYRGDSKYSNDSDCLSDDRKKKLEKDKKELAETMTQESSSEAVPGQPHIDVDIRVMKGDGFKAVAGMNDLKRRLKRDFIDVVSNNELAKTFEVECSNLIMYGPPGVGKTYIATRLAEECGMECSVVGPSDLSCIYVHGSQTMIRELFDKAKEKSKQNGRGVLLILDEFDALCPQRTVDDRNNQSGEVAEFLVQLNNCQENKVYVIGTTNCLDKIDRAVIRKGRIDEIIYVGMPDEDCREQIFEYELKKRPHEEDIDFKVLVKMTEGFSSSDISFLVKESARNSFEASLKTEDKHIVKISQSILESVIMEMRPSVTADEVKHYEKMRDEYVKGRKAERPRVGYKR